MLALSIIAAVIILILITPVGADAAFGGDGPFSLKIVIGPLRLTLLPPKPKKEKKPKKPKAKKAKKKPADGEKKPKLKLALGDIFALAKIALAALGRFRRKLSLDVLTLHLIAGAPDPYDAVMQYNYLNTGLGVLWPLLNRAFNIRRRDVRTALDIGAEGLAAEGRVKATLRIGQILHIANCALYALIKWYLPRRRAEKAAEKAAAAGKTETLNAEGQKG